MDILAAEYIYEGLKKYNSTQGNPYGNKVVDEEPLDPVYPITIISEIRNKATAAYNTPYERVASVGYAIDIYAQTKGKISKKQIARELAEVADKYMTNIGLLRIGFVPDGLVRDASLYRITMTYSGNLHENRRTMI